MRFLQLDLSVKPEPGRGLGSHFPPFPLDDSLCSGESAEPEAATSVAGLGVLFFFFSAGVRIPFLEIPITCVIVGFEMYYPAPNQFE